jgi:cytochrome c oxidase cbb3-type subunit I/II
MQAFRMPWYNGGTVIMQLHFSSQRHSWGLCIIFCPKLQTDLYIPINYPSFTSGRSYSFTSGPVRTTCLYTALPDWAQSLGTVFSIMLIAPSWGGMLNGLLTLRGAWDRVREHPVLKFMVVAVTAYGMSTFEGPMLSLKNFNAVAHYTDYIIGHVHIGGLGWNGFLTFGILYWMIPKCGIPKLHSTEAGQSPFLDWITWYHFSMHLPLYASFFVQTLMWKQFTPDGILAYPNFLETVTQIVPMYMLRAFGGLLYWIGVW